MKLFSASLGGLLVSAAVFGGTLAALEPAQWAVPIRTTTSTNNAYVRGDVTPLSPRISGYVTEVLIEDNQAVQAGDILFRIDDRDYRARVDQAAAGVATRRALVANLTSRIELQRAVIEQAAAALQGAEADADRAGRDFARIAELTDHGWASQQRNDQVKADHLRARAKIGEAQASLAATKRQMDVLESQRPQLLADVAAANAALELAQIELDSTAVRAPADGWVGERQARVGQYVRPGTLLVAVVPQHFWVVANFKETQIPSLNSGDRVSITVDGVPHARFTGRLESFSPASGAQFALLPPDNATGNFTRITQRIPVKITLDEGQPGFDRLRPGMSATVVLAKSGKVKKSVVVSR
jgi:membrane fusion protein, multidrug efflux system